MDLITKYLIEEAGVMVPVIWTLAEIIKRTEKVSNNYIPLILLGASIGLTPLILGGYNPQNIAQAFLVVGVEMLGYQVYDKTKAVISERQEK